MDATPLAAPGLPQPTIRLGCRCWNRFRCFASAGRAALSLPFQEEGREAWLQGPVGSRMTSWCTVHSKRTSPVSYVWGCRPRQRGLTWVGEGDTLFDLEHHDPGLSFGVTRTLPFGIQSKYRFKIYSCRSFTGVSRVLVRLGQVIVQQLHVLQAVS